MKRRQIDIRLLNAFTRGVFPKMLHAHLELARIMQRRGRLAAERLSAPYPEDLEHAVVAYVQLELGRMKRVADSGDTASPSADKTTAPISTET